MRFLITGAGGFVGAGLAREVIARGAEAHGIVRSDPIRLHDLGGAVAIHWIDLKDSDAVRSTLEAVRPDIVIHTAAKLGHPGTGRERVEAWADSLLATVSLLEGLRGIELRRFVHVCSSTVFRNSDLPHTEDDPLEPRLAWVAVEAPEERSPRRGVVPNPVGVHPALAQILGVVDAASDLRPASARASARTLAVAARGT